MMKKLFLCLLLALLALPVAAVDITVDGVKRSYVIYLPKNLGQNRPLLISCHGMNQDANYQKGMLQIESIADTAKFVTVFPEGIDRGWDISGDRDIRFMQAIIDEMVRLYKVDANRVYLSGFSMGGMFTYHAMNRMADKIAAFAPISGYPMWGTTASPSVRPLPIIHTHGTSDDVVNFSGVQGALNAWINHNHCPTTAKVQKNYRAQHITRHTWGPGDNGVEVVLLELAGKGHWVSNDVVKTGEEIWRFCKRYALQMKDPVPKITKPAGDLSFITMGGVPEAQDITLEATATDPDGRVVSVAFYDGEELLATITEPPYTCTAEALGKGRHELRAVATDDEGRTGETSVVVNIEVPSGYHLMHNTFNTEGSVPEGWSTGDGEVQRTGFSTGYQQGSRLFQFTGAKHDFDWGLYTRNVSGAHHAGYARYADKGTNTTLTLLPGTYQLRYKVCNWNQPDFSPVIVAVETVDGQEVFANTFKPTANVGNNATNSFSGCRLLNSQFEVPAKDRYVVTFYTADAPWADLVVGYASLFFKGSTSAIQPSTLHPSPSTHYYTLSGQRVSHPQQGLYVVKDKQGSRVVTY